MANPAAVSTTVQFTRRQAMNEELLPRNRQWKKLESRPGALPPCVMLLTIVNWKRKKVE